MNKQDMVLEVLREYADRDEKADYSVIAQRCGCSRKSVRVYVRHLLVANRILRTAPRTFVIVTPRVIPPRPVAQTKAVIESTFIRPPTKAQLMAGRA